MQSITQVQLLQINRQVDKILHTPGNFKWDGRQLEMAFVLDGCSNADFLREGAKAIAASLKAHDKIFQNVRCNVVCWNRDNSFSNQVIPMSFLQMGRVEVVESCAGESEGKRQIECLYEYLKKFHARSKCIIFLTDREYPLSDEERAREALTPFLRKKLLHIGGFYDIV